MPLNIEDLPKGPFQKIYSYWLDKKGENKSPLATDVDILDVPELIPFITIFDIEGERVRIRFIGGQIVDEAGEDPTGHYLDEMPDKKVIEQRSLHCAKTGSPYYHPRLEVTWDSLHHASYSTLTLPCVDAEGKVISIIFLISFN